MKAPETFLAFRSLRFVFFFFFVVFLNFKRSPMGLGLLQEKKSVASYTDKWVFKRETILYDPVQGVKLTHRRCLAGMKTIKENPEHDVDLNSETHALHYHPITYWAPGMCRWNRQTCCFCNFFQVVILCYCFWFR